MINWQNRQHRIIIISVISLIVIVMGIIFWLFNRQSDSNKSLVVQSNLQTEEAAINLPISVIQRREQERSRLKKADHDKALYQELLTSKDSNRCVEMEGLEGREICLLSLAKEFNDSSLCEKIDILEWKKACQSEFFVNTKK